MPVPPSPRVAVKRASLSQVIQSARFSLKHDFILNWSFNVRRQQVVPDDTPTAQKDQLTAKFLGLKLEAYGFSRSAGGTA